MNKPRSLLMIANDKSTGIQKKPKEYKTHDSTHKRNKISVGKHKHVIEKQKWVQQSQEDCRDGKKRVKWAREAAILPPPSLSRARAQ